MKPVTLISSAVLRYGGEASAANHVPEAGS
jgi:hypothetical protein